MILSLVAAAAAKGVPQKATCAILEIDPRTVQRWRARGGGEDRRAGPNSAPKNRLSEKERRFIVTLLCSAEYRDLPVDQVVAQLADRGKYYASASTMRRIDGLETKAPSG